MGVTAPVAICLAGGWPPTPSNLRGLDAWIRSEKPAGQPWQWFNPLNTTDRWGSIGIAPYGPGISIYPDPATGAMANARTIKGLDGMVGWPGIEDSLRHGRLGKDFFSGAAGLLDPPGGSAWGSNPVTVESILHNPNPSPLGGTNNARLDVAGMGGSGSIAGLGIGKKIADPLGFITGIHDAITAISNGLKTFARFAEVTAGGAVMGAGLVVMVAAASGVAETTADAVVKSKTRGLVSTGDAQARHEAKLAATTQAHGERREQERQIREKEALDISDIRLSQWVSAEEQKSWQQFWRGEARRRQRVKKGEGEPAEEILADIGDFFKGLFAEGRED